MYNALETLYYPADSTILVENIFASPWVAFVAYKLLHPEGGYRSIWDIPPLLSKAQYCARLRGARHLKTTLDAHRARSDVDLESGEGPSWFQ